jgi:hypothetical protein
LAGAIGGGLGLKLAANWAMRQMTVYIAFAFVVAATYFGVLPYWHFSATKVTDR